MSGEFDTLLQAVEHNAQRLGADVVWIKKLTWWGLHAWIDPRKIEQTETTAPTESDWKEYERQMKAYEKAKDEGKSARLPKRPEPSHSSVEKTLPGRWDIKGSAMLEAVFIETPYALVDDFAPSPKRDSDAAAKHAEKLAPSIMDQARVEGQSTLLKQASKPRNFRPR